MTCRETTRLVASGELEAAPLLTRVSVRLHWLVCAHCRRFRRELEVLSRAARLWANRLVDQTRLAELEKRLMDLGRRS